MPARLQNLSLLLGRLLLASLFLPSGIAKLWSLAPFTAMLRDKGVPFPEAVAIVAVAVEIIGPVCLVVGLAPRLAALLLAAFTAAATLVSHRYWTIAEPAARAVQSLHAAKNLAIIGGLLGHAAAGAGEWSLSRLGRRGAKPPARKTARR